MSKKHKTPQPAALQISIISQCKEDTIKLMLKAGSDRCKNKLISENEAELTGSRDQLTPGYCDR